MKRHCPYETNTNNRKAKNSYDPDDMGGVVTDTPLIPLLYKVVKEQYMIKNMFSKKDGRLVYLCSDLCLHVGQNDAWSCGYRNLQMLLSVLLPTIGDHGNESEISDSASTSDNTHNSRQTKQRITPKFRNNDFDHTSPLAPTTSSEGNTDDDYCAVVEVVDLTTSSDDDITSPVRGNSMHHTSLITDDSYGKVNPHYTLSFFFPELKIPKLKTLQHHMENAWRQGFDVEGAQHYHGKLTGSKEWIGAAEVSSLLNYFSINASVIQFINTARSRAPLGSFVYWYFSQPESTTALDILKMAETLTASEIPVTGINQCSKKRFPLYLQWEGHSVSIVGIDVVISDRNSSGSLLNSKNINLLLFDPQKRGSTLRTKLVAGKAWQDSIILPVLELANKDCQIIHCSSKMLPGLDRYRQRSEIRGFTASGHT